MNGDKKIYLYSGLAIALAVVAYFVITGTKTIDFRFSDDGFSGKSGRVFFIKMA